MIALKRFLTQEKSQGKTIFPNNKDLFKAFNLTGFNSVKVVILGQDPYHGPNQAHGLSFSVKPGVTPPPSLVNIYKELHRDLNISIPNHGHLESWAKQGVLLLNSVLSVEMGQAASHQGKGWERFTDAVIEAINTHLEHVVFMLWGNYAQRKGQFIDREKHLVLTTSHPSPLSAYRGFFGCGHFSQTNQYLAHHQKSMINWQLPNSIETLHSNTLTDTRA